MEKMSPDKIKTGLLIVYVTISLALILGLWGTALFKSDESQPGFYRATTMPVTPAAESTAENHPNLATPSAPAATPSLPASSATAEATEPVDQVN